jgi:hypothetical protein
VSHYACLYRTRLGDRAQNEVSDKARALDKAKLTMWREHVYRTHELPITCPRCKSEFKSDEERAEHLVAENRCDLVTVTGREGFSPDQKKRLKARPRKQLPLSEVEKWKEMYLILFKDTEECDIPTPCENPRLKNLVIANIHLVYDAPCAQEYQILIDFKDHIVTNLPSRLLERIMNTGLQFPDIDAENRFRTNFQDIFAEQAENLFLEYPRPNPAIELVPKPLTMPTQMLSIDSDRNNATQSSQQQALGAPTYDLGQGLLSCNLPLTPQSDPSRNSDDKLMLEYDASQDSQLAESADRVPFVDVNFAALFEDLENEFAEEYPPVVEPDSSRILE